MPGSWDGPGPWQLLRLFTCLSHCCFFFFFFQLTTQQITQGPQQKVAYATQPTLKTQFLTTPISQAQKLAGTQQVQTQIQVSMVLLQLCADVTVNTCYFQGLIRTETSQLGQICVHIHTQRETTFHVFTPIFS